jgi:secreted PhoX family phosphatase
LFDGMPSFDPDALTRSDQEKRFGQNNDMLALFPAQYSFPWPADQASLLMCANHEYVEPALLFPANASAGAMSAAQWEAAFAAVGVSVVQVEQNNGDWRVHQDAAPGLGLNRRITPFTPVVFAGPAAQHRWIAAAATAVNAASPGAAADVSAVHCGTLANCAGGKTPWGTYLTSEENFDGFFRLSDASAPPIASAQADSAWIYDAGRFGYPLFSNSNTSAPTPPQFDVAHNPYGPSLYGWVTEIDPYDPNWAPRKRTALGRKKGECATTAIAKDGRVACYMGDDQIDHFVFKFVTEGRFDPANRLANRDLLDHGKLYAARFNEDGSGDWVELTLDACNRAIAEAPYHQPFSDVGDVAMRAREAAVLLGATPMDRPEDVEAPVDEQWRGYGMALIVCTNNRNESFAHPGNPRRGEAQSTRVQQSNPAGHIIRIDEANADHAAARFTWDVFVLAGDPAAAPDESTSVVADGAPTITGERFACPDNICFDRSMNVWIATDGSPAVLSDCNDAVLTAPVISEGPRPVKRFLVGPVGAEICGPTLALDERAFLCAIQHPGENDGGGTDIRELRWRRGQRPPSSFPDGNGAWPRSAVIVVSRDDGGKVGT